MTDAFTDSLFPTTPFEADRVVFRVSRLICDVERFPEDADEPMAARGMGAVYVAMSDGSPLRRNLSPSERARIMRQWYDPHHAALTSAVDRVIGEGHSCLIVDCHSFSSRPLPHEPDQEPGRPDICIGTDPFHTPGGVENTLAMAGSAAGLSVLINRPFGVGGTRG
jgi:N-formylglutamate amidohydrolase